MRVLFLTDNFPPELNAPASRTYEHCREWVKKGVDVTVITCAPNFPTGKVFSGYRNRLYSRENIDGIKVIRVWTFITSNTGFLKRVLDYVSFAITSFFAGLFVKTDIIIATSPQFFTTWSGYALSAVKRKPWIFEVRDLWPESIKSVGAIRHKRVLTFLEKIELFLYRKASRVVVVTAAFKRNLVERGIRGKKISIVTNGANLELFSPRPKPVRLLRRLGLGREFIISYVGTHGMAHGLDFIIQAIAAMSNNNVHFVFIGDGAEKGKVKDLAQSLQLVNVTFLDPVPKEEVVEWLALSDACLVPLKKSDTFKTVIPSKIFEAAAMGKPVILGVEGQAKEIVEEYGAGICYVPENEKSFLEAIDKIASDSKYYASKQAGCYNLAQAYDRKRLAIDMLGILDELVSKK